jgi:release factor glutamine methyltransferase
MPEVRRLLEEAAKRLDAAGIDRPVFEAQLLLGVALGLTRLDVLRGPGSPVTDVQRLRFKKLVDQRVARVPLAYLRGTQEFYGLEFEVSPDVLVPRPETELLVEYAVEALSGQPGATLVDVGTGSGCIAVVASVHLPNARAIAIDRSGEALKVALRNAHRHGMAARIQFVCGDMLDAIRGAHAEMIVSNPPYIPSKEVDQLQPEVRDHEPRLALDGGTTGLDFHTRLIAGARRVLKPGGWIGIEVAMGQAPTVLELLTNAGFRNVRAKKDLAGIERMVTGQWITARSSR